MQPMPRIPVIITLSTTQLDPERRDEITTNRRQPAQRPRTTGGYVKIRQICTNTRVVLGVLLIQTICVVFGQALAAEPSPPLVVTIGANPYQYVAAISSSATCPAQQCMFTFPPVPTGQRLVITHVSAQVGPADLVILENGPPLFVPKANSSSSYLSGQVIYYINSGDIPAARIFYPNTTDNTSLIVTLSGYLVPNQ
jgi:hypothetical protein